MKLAIDTRNQIIRNALLSVLIYAAPVLLMCLTLRLTHAQLHSPERHASTELEHALQSFNAYGLSVFMLVLGVLEFATGLYENHWSRNERLSCRV